MKNRCPFCGSKIEACGAGLARPPGKSWVARCCNPICDAYGPLAETKEEALRVFSSRSKPRPLGGPAWVLCSGGCGEFWCRIHGMHAYDCPCKPIEEWKVDPYVTGGPPGVSCGTAIRLVNKKGRKP